MIRKSTSLQHEIARTACYEVSQLAMLLRSHLEDNDRSGELAPALRGGLMRMGDLSDIMFDALFSEERDCTEADLVRRVGGDAALSALEKDCAA